MLLLYGHHAIPLQVAVTFLLHRLQQRPSARMQQVPPPPPPFLGGSASPPPAALPAGWTEHWAPNNVPYYFQASTGVSTYVRPTMAASPPPPPPGFGGALPGAVAGPSGDASPAIEASPAKKDKKKKKEKPVEKLPIDGTPWLRVTTNEGNVFYTNTETKTSVWTVPEEIADQVKEQLQKQEQKALEAHAAAEAERKAAAAAAAAAAEAARLLQEKEAEMQRLREDLEREREASKKRKLEEEEQEERLQKESQEQAAKKAKVATVEDDDEGSLKQHQDKHQSEQAESDRDQEELEEWQKEEIKAKKELDKELEEPAPASQQTEFSSEEAIALFKIMLAEKDINPIRPWDMELPKFINDSRYRGVKTLRERRDLFDEHCKHLVRERRAKKAASGQKKADPASVYRALLVSEVTSTRTHWEDFRQKFKKDSRFRDFGRDDREREKAFKAWLRELGEIKRADALKAEEKFVTMLKEKDIPDGSKWSDVKSGFSSDPRYAAVASSSQREEIFRKYMTTRPKPASEAQVRDSQAEEDDRRKAAAEERKAKQQASLREREEKVKRDKAALDRTTGRVRAEVSREESTREYKNLLIDAVRDHEAKWNDSLPGLEKDPRFSSNSLSLSEKRRLFDEHLDEVYDKRIAALEGLFAEHAPKLTTRFDDVYSSISASPVVTRLHLSESRLEGLYDSWNRKRFERARKDFDTMLSESKFVDYWGRLKQDAASKDEEDRTKDLLGNDNEDDEELNAENAVDLKTMAAQIDMKEINSVLKHDKRFTVFDHDSQAREQWIREYISRLDKPKQTVHQSVRH